MKTLFYFFTKYLLAPILITLLLVVINNLNKVKKQLNIKKLIVFILIAGIILALPSLFGLLNNEFVWAGLMLSIFFYLLFGIAFTRFIKTRMFESFGLKDYKPAIFILMFALAVFSIWIYYMVFSWLSQLPYATSAMFTVLWYVVPLFFLLSKKYFLEISRPFYKSWEVDFNQFNRNNWDDIDNFKAQQVKVKIKRKHTDKEYISLTVRMLDKISLGNWFNWFVEDQNIRFPTNIIETQIDDENIGWIFYTSRWFKFPLFIRVLDPEKSREENSIKPNRTIYVRRTKVERSTDE